jgi:hypothetical protein
MPFSARRFTHAARAAAAAVAAVLFMTILGHPTLAEQTQWESRGIGGGGALFSPSLSPHDPAVITMATDMTGVFRTEDFGARWTTLPFRTLRGGGDTHVRFTADPSVLYAVHIGDWGERIPVRSDDGGATFAPLASDPTFGECFTLHADPNDAARVLIASWSELFFSDDGGDSFTQVFDAGGAGSGLHVGGSFWDGTDVFAGTNFGLLVSADGGAGFALDGATGIPGDRAIVSFAGAKEGGLVRFFAVTYPGADVWGGITQYGYEAMGIEQKTYRLDRGDPAWTRVSAGISNDDHYGFLGMAANDVDVVYLAGGSSATGYPVVLKTTDGGASWRHVFLADGNENIATGWAGSGGDLEWYWPEVALGLAVAPNDPDRAVITDFGFVHVTGDGGASWRQAYVDPFYENPAGAPTPEGRAYATSGVEQTAAWWLHWDSPEIIVAGFTDIRGTRSTDGGLTWAAGSSLGLPHNTTYHVIGHPNGNIYAATSTVHDLYQSTYLTDARIDGGDGHVMVSGDGGASWQLLHDFGHPVIWLALDPGDSETLYASVVHSAQGGIYVTHDLTSGAGFAALPDPPRTEGHPFNIRILDDGTLVTSWSGRRDGSGAFTQSSGIFASTDGGGSWEDRSHPNMVRWTKDVVVDPHDPGQNTWYAAVFSHWGAYPNEVGGVYRTTDRGLSWDWMNDLYRVESLAIDPGDPDVAYAMTEVEGLWRTENLTDPAPIFEQDADYPFQHPVRIFFNPFVPGETWCASFGGGLRVKGAGSSGVVKDPGEGFESPTRQGAVRLFGSHPNPFRGSTAIGFAIPRDLPVDLAVYGPDGGRIRTLVSGILPAGRHEATWDGRGPGGREQGAGVYFYRVRAGEEIRTGSVRLVK